MWPQQGHIMIGPESSIEGVFEKSLFWDVQMDNILIAEDREFIAHRVMSWPSHSNALDILDQLYDEEFIKAAAKASQGGRYAPEYIELLSKRYDIPLQEFEDYVPECV